MCSPGRAVLRKPAAMAPRRQEQAHRDEDEREAHQPKPFHKRAIPIWETAGVWRPDWLDYKRRILRPIDKARDVPREFEMDPQTWLMYSHHPYAPFTGDAIHWHSFFYDDAATCAFDSGSVCAAFTSYAAAYHNLLRCSPARYASWPSASLRARARICAHTEPAKARCCTSQSLHTHSA